MVSCVIERMTAATNVATSEYGVTLAMPAEASPEPPLEKDAKETQETHAACRFLPKADVLYSGLLAFIGIGVLSCLRYWIADEHDYTLILGSFGASAVLLYGAPHLPLAQPRNCVGGHVLSCFIGVACWEAFAKPFEDDSPWLALPFAAAFATMGMQVTGTVHPPAGGTVLIAVLGSKKLHDMQFELLIPTFVGSVLLVAVAMLNNFVPGRQKYPQRWN